MQNIISLPWHTKKVLKKEESLIKKAVKGDKESYVSLIKENKENLYKIAYSYVKDEQRALDILSEATYKGMMNISKLKKEEFFKTWITRILINTAIRELKKEEKYVYTEDDSPLIVDESKNSTCEKMDLYSAMDKLKPIYKSVIMLRYFNDMSIDNIAEVLDIPSSTVKSHIRRGKEALKKYLREDYMNEY
ncbi:sigma-70 family RNA polymerase sigma factor [uncultured Clostridium sp.]|uniref:sigma-70 family RNA polymerase sigma factor n=1 Tax=uncultured Clostridium sp. TaxID=59620 RepID=UPI00262206AD|nr:sigma-70 family RNA polymerase sigma factor [uncultured Clostridium sp.]